MNINELRMEFYSSMSREELDHHFSPSKFAMSDRATVVDRHTAALQKSTKGARETVECDLGVIFNGTGQSLDIYYPPQVNAETRIMIFFHGGYWQALSLDESGGHAIPLSAHNVILVSIGYQLAPSANMTEIVRQCREGCAFIYKKFPNKKIIISGNSAGGHLSSVMLATNWREYGLDKYPFHGAILFSGVYDLVPIQKCYVNDPLQLTGQEVRDYSPLGSNCIEKLRDLVPKGFPCLLVEGKSDPTSFQKMRESYQKVLEDAGINVKLEILEEDDHFSYVEKMYSEEHEVTKIMIQFICKEI
ncbi:PREDICTED: kynurenine formamidase-like [Amphimedon queenslandica]|uniref:BD-FAE-like domain-containing protein n=1 Tax=Amphimedon queenslandica TaxID=400682 RepID=A0A1X7UR41_AMPQE|nr:PREDICTED: kynurenine formamidase-like [Amphimedon queenslandica]|eukprot:XP_011404297.2 PREDICTED: kynurenine formamidase-like [Amphimedon queenslandica]